MASKSSIEWTDATWNPTTGCTKISEGCKNCYAEKFSMKLKNNFKSKKYSKGFKFTIHKNDLEIPLHWKKSRNIFVNSMSDLFHEKTDLAFVAECFEVMDTACQHNYQILTKRPESMCDFIKSYTKLLKKNLRSHIWLGTSVENKKTVFRIKELQKINAPIKFISFEPLIGPVGKLDLKGINWVIIGGESGPNFRPVKEDWINEIITQAEFQNVPIFFKQWGGKTPKSGGRIINNRTYEEYPKV